MDCRNFSDSMVCFGASQALLSRAESSSESEARPPKHSPNGRASGSREVGGRAQRVLGPGPTSWRAVAKAPLEKESRSCFRMATGYRYNPISTGALLQEELDQGRIPGITEEDVGPAATFWWRAILEEEDAEPVEVDLTVLGLALGAMMSEKRATAVEGPAPAATPLCKKTWYAGC